MSGASGAGSGPPRARSADEEARLAALVLRGALLKQERAATAGVTAYCRRVLPRERPNARFLLNTVRNAQSANRSAIESQMWAARAKQRRLEAAAAGSSGGSPSADGASSGDNDPSPSGSDGTENSSGSLGGRKRKRERRVDDAANGASGAAAQRCGRPPDTLGSDAEGDDALQALLSRHRVRGRGEVGSRAEETGPYLDPPAPAPGPFVYTMLDAPPRAALGPAVPPGLAARRRRERSASLDSSGSEASSEGSEERWHKRRRNGSPGRTKRRKDKSDRKKIKHKSDKKKRSKKKRKKEKSERRRRSRSASSSSLSSSDATRSEN